MSTYLIIKTNYIDKKYEISDIGQRKTSTDAPPTLLSANHETVVYWWAWPILLVYALEIACLANETPWNHFYFFHIDTDKLYEHYNAYMYLFRNEHINIC